MIAQVDIGARAEEIRNFVAGGELGVAIKKGMDFVRDFADAADQDECVLLSFDFKLVDGEMRQEKLSTKASLAERRRLAGNLLKLVRKILDEKILDEALSLETVRG